MRVLLVHAHPSADAYSGALRDAAVRGLVAGGHDVDVLDLYGRHFRAAMTRNERLAYETDMPILDPMVLADATLLAAAEALVFVYPTWWWGMPAIMKGWLERVLVPGVAFRLEPGSTRVKPALGHVRRLVGVSTYGSSQWSIRFFNDAGRRTVTRCVRLLAAKRCRTRWLALYALDTSNLEQRQAFLARVERELATL